MNLIGGEAECIILDQGCPTYGPQAACGPGQLIVSPAILVAALPHKVAWPSTEQRAKHRPKTIPLHSVWPGQAKKLDTHESKPLLKQFSTASCTNKHPDKS